MNTTTPRRPIAHKVLELKSPPYPPGSSGQQVAPYPAEFRPLQPLGRCLVVDVATAADFRIVRLDELETGELLALTGAGTLPDGRPARAVRIGWERIRHTGASALRPAKMHALLYLELDTDAMSTRLRSVGADGFAEAREEARRRERSAAMSMPQADLSAGQWPAEPPEPLPAPPSETETPAAPASSPPSTSGDPPTN